MSVGTTSIGRCVISAILLITALLSSRALADTAATSPSAQSAQLGPWADKDFNQLDQAERDAAKKAARTVHFTTLRVCADPGNMPLSDRAGEGFENKIAQLMAKAMGAKLSYFWRPYVQRGITRQTFDVNACDLLMDMPVGYQGIITTIPIYRTTYVLVSRDDAKLSVKSLDDPRLKKLRVGVFQTSALREALAQHGVVANVQVQLVRPDADLVPAHQPWRQVQDVVDGKLDVAAVWGPFAGWVKTMKGAHITIEPTNLMDDAIPMEFSLGIGVPKYDAVLKYALDDALKAHREEIGEILTSYGVPLVECADCLIAGNLPAHGIYAEPAPAAQNYRKPTHWTVSRAQVDKWLADGADVSDELDDAVEANDVDRAAYLIGKGADVNRWDNLGTPPLATAARYGCIPMVQLLFEHGAKVDRSDSDGWTPLMRAVRYNQVAAIKVLVAHGAKPDLVIPGGYTPLSIAIEERQFDAAYALIEAGADVDTPVSIHRLTPLMIVASERPPESRTIRLLQNHGPIDIARALLAHKANVDAADADGVTALMIAAARDNSAMIGLLLQAGANPHIKSAAGETARDIAIKNDNLGAMRTFALLVHQ